MVTEIVRKSSPQPNDSSRKGNLANVGLNSIHTGSGVLPYAPRNYGTMNTNAYNSLSTKSYGQASIPKIVPLSGGKNSQTVN